MAAACTCLRPVRVARARVCACACACLCLSMQVACGQRLPAKQEDLTLKGAALEARVYAERPGKCAPLFAAALSCAIASHVVCPASHGLCSNYLPATGKLIRHRPPAQSASVRVDSGITQGDSISTFYDPMIAKLITYGVCRCPWCTGLACMQRCSVCVW